MQAQKKNMVRNFFYRRGPSFRFLKSRERTFSSSPRSLSSSSSSRFQFIKPLIDRGKQLFASQSLEMSPSLEAVHDVDWWQWCRGTERHCALYAASWFISFAHFRLNICIFAEQCEKSRFVNAVASLSSNGQSFPEMTFVRCRPCCYLHCIITMLLPCFVVWTSTLESASGPVMFYHALLRLTGVLT